MTTPHPSGQIVPNDNGPYRVEGDLVLTDARGARSIADKPMFLCRCGGSANKPFCDGTHKRNGFDGTLTADLEPMAERRVAYEGAGITVYDDRSRCAHAGTCTAGLPSVWRLGQEPWIDARTGGAAEIAEVVRSCPSGALTYALPGEPTPVEELLPAEIVAVPDGPLHVRGGIPVVTPAGETYEVRNRQTLCRCGQSRNKPFCDGSHWDAGFRDPGDPSAGT